MAHEPRRFQRHAQDAMKLVRANALFAGRHQVDCLKPETKRDMAGLEHRSDRGAERLPALIAFVNANPGALALQLADSIHSAAVGAYRAVGPDALFDVGISGVFVVKVFLI